MKKYYLGIGFMDLSKRNALCECENIKNAREELETLKEKILIGAYDEEWNIAESERQEIADNTFVFYIEYSKTGSVRNKGIIEY